MTPKQSQDAARRVIALERDGLDRLASSIDDRFSAVVDLVRAVKGRLVCAGVGKSGHVARKIAATLASTGTPAQFVHPTEASHGDLGMITPDDAVLALSKSGETSELGDLMAYCRRFSTPLIAMTAGQESMLARAADYHLFIPDAEEACGETRAPTTSTTLMMALGDALAVALIEARGFTAGDFKTYHPGGTLGAALMTVSDLMHSGDGLPLTGEATAMGDAVAIMTEKGLGCVGVTGADGTLTGMITDGDIRRHIASDLPARAALDVMTSQPKTVGPDTLAADALRLMTAGSVKITQLFVVDAGGRPLGLLHIHDLLKAGLK
ncbi:KpsF/GutQ family sugar-phosphate isomerase [Hyphobacterium marinum]|uniref:KpsF/GutQ family sugar-phosphate isomerase n=1 Tax=Hyphobacterium marinum TaxID=3116574 RepID=A0ABU7LYY9_9PROT|nr:KpsF/GutQ family sugar-phosphate isomerase [Hyphobacterium sp. Y6023]MEE2566492.1 KpsF/GutQ family sugar-phosphate isomerase [Hyphobacterium sp. Y6023]